MTASLIPFIRPMRLPELLDRAIRLYRRNFGQFIGIIAIPYIPLTLVQVALSYVSTSSLVSARVDPSSGLPFFGPSYWLSLLGMFGVIVLEIILVSGIATAALTRAVADSYSGQPVGVLAAYRNIGKSWPRLLGAILTYMVVVVALAMWTIIPCIGWLTGPGALFFLAGAVVPLVAPVVILEKQDVFLSLRRAWDLARSRFWWLVGFSLALGLLSRLIVAGPVYLVNFLITVVFGNQFNPDQALVLNSVSQSLITMLASLLYLPLSLTAMTLVYFDLRVRSEGLDLALQAAGAAGEEANIITVAGTSPPPQGKFITGTDVAYFTLLSLIAGAIFALILSLMAGLAVSASSFFPVP